MKELQFGAYRLSTMSALRLTAPLLGAVLLAAPVYGRDMKRDPSASALPSILQVPVVLRVPAGNEVSFRATGVGVQIYVWTVDAVTGGGSWVFKAPHATLFREDGVVGIHFAGPTWESLSGSAVVGQRVAGSTVNPTAIPWLLLKAKSTSGTGVFADTTFIQRLRTIGGLAPTMPGTAGGEEALVPYIAEYVFYRATL